MNQNLKNLLISNNVEDVKLGLEIAKRQKVDPILVAKIYWYKKLSWEAILEFNQQLNFNSKGNPKWKE